MTTKRGDKRLGFDPFGGKSAFDNLIPEDDTKVTETSEVPEVTVTPGVTATPETTEVTSTSPTTNTTVVNRTPKTTVVPMVRNVTKSSVRTPVSLGDEPVFTPTRGMKEGWERHTYSIKTHHVELIEAEAYWRRKDQKDILDEALEAYFAERKVRPLPPEERKERKPRKKR